MSKGRPSEIAIIGMGCRFAGASDLSTYFENILAARDCTRDVPPDRWDPATFCEPASAAHDRLAGCRGGYLDSPIPFDAALHGIMPRTIEGGEPEQFLVLDAATAALADAGIDRQDLAERRVEVVIGRGNYFNRGNLTRLQHGRMIAQIISLLEAFFPQWTDADREAVRADLRSSLPPFEAATIPGQLTNATAGRVASRLDLKGASYVVDSASASSLVALDLAMRALNDRRADLAIAGGVYLEADVDFPLVFRQLGALSRSGVARPFTADADGMVPGEGVGVVVLKRRRDAERAGDRIYALVKGVGLSGDGRGHGLAAPSARGHARAIRRAIRRAGVDPSSIMLVEGHGLGVPAADRAELRALNAVFRPLARGRRYLGAVSSMIGHAMPAAGMAGLIKTALAIYHRVLPPTLHSDQPHPLLSEPRSTFTLNPTARPWIQADPDVPRRAGVSAFGFAGINAHAVLEEHAASADGEAPGALEHWDTEAILLSAFDRAGLISRARELAAWFERHPGESLKDIAYTLNCVGEHPPGAERLGLVAASTLDLARRLTTLLSRLEDPACRIIRDGRGVYYWNEPLYTAGAAPLAFLFPGEGSQYPGMLADLCIHFPEVRRYFDTADRIARELGETESPSDHLFGLSERADEKLSSAATAVNVVLNAQWALYQVLVRLGLKPDAVVGHSSGELLALAAAGVFPADRELELKLGRLGAIFRGFESSGDLPAARLVAIAAECGRIERLCRDAGVTGAAVAMDNCPHQVVMALPPAEAEPVFCRLRAENILWEDLPFVRAYHTASFQAVVGPIAGFFDELAFRPPCLPIYSCASRGRMPESVDGIRELVVAQWTQSVAFRQTIEAMYADGLRLFVDVGARGNLAGFVEDILRGRPAFAIAANVPRRSGLTQLNHLVAATFAQGAQLDPGYLYARRRARAIDWDAPEQAPRNVVNLRIGFPEMRISERVIEQLRPATGVCEPREAPDCAPILGDPHSASDERSVHDRPARNGTCHDGNPRTQVGADAAAHETQITMTLGRQFAPWLDVESLRLAIQTEPPENDTGPGSASDVDRAMLSFQATMQAFLKTQHEVMAACLASPVTDHSDRSPAHDACSVPTPSSNAALVGSGPNPGPWAGEIERLAPAEEIETRLVLDVRDDPIAQNHTLGGCKVSAVDPTLLGLPVLPFAVMAEMTAQVAALLVTPGLVLLGLSQVRAHKWVRYEEEPVHLELRGRRAPSTSDERVWVGIYNRGPGGRLQAPRPVFEAVVSFGESTPPGAPAGGYSLGASRPCRFTPESVYGEQWLFHGPAFQAIARVGDISEKGIEGTIRVLPLDTLIKQGHQAHFQTDLIVIDTFTQLLGCWGLDHLTEGDVVFPLSMAELHVHGDRPPLGTLVECRISVEEIQRHRVRVCAEIVRPDGTIWIRIDNWEDWRFHWPGRYRDVFRQPRDYFAGEELPLDDSAGGAARRAKAVWLEPPADMGRPVWRDVLEQTQLRPPERAKLHASIGSERQRTHRLWGKVAAKEAVRRLWQSGGHAPIYPADLEIADDETPRPRLIAASAIGDLLRPTISIADCDRVSVALAALDPHARAGIAVAPITDRLEDVLAKTFTDAERSLLDRCQRSSRAEWIARFCCAKEAAGKAAGLPSNGDPAVFQVIGFDEESGAIRVALVPAIVASPSDQSVNPVRVVSARRSEYAWAWTIAEGADL
jgi:acyl transferase domain-containing protein/phosphopantetheinyl transferase (holo-ACP synthase)